MVLSGNTGTQARTRLPHRAVRNTGGTHLIVLLDGKNSEDSERMR